MELKPAEAKKLIQPHPLTIVTTTNKEGVPDAATFSWISPVSAEPPLVCIMVSEERQTYENLEENGEFVINIITKHCLEDAVYLGTKSFKDEPEKMENTELTLEKGKEAKASRINEAIGWIECEVKDMVKEGDHYMVVGKVLGGAVADEFWKDGRLKVEEAETLHHLGGNEFLTPGEVIEFKK
ncbi:MAG: flavin reductase family protein [Candidatus Aenigmatarchaeota archaeon]